MVVGPAGARGWAWWPQCAGALERAIGAQVWRQGRSSAGPRGVWLVVVAPWWRWNARPELAADGRPMVALASRGGA